LRWKGGGKIRGVQYCEAAKLGRGKTQLMKTLSRINKDAIDPSLSTGKNAEEPMTERYSQRSVKQKGRRGSGGAMTEGMTCDVFGKEAFEIAIRAQRKSAVWEKRRTEMMRRRTLNHFSGPS